MTETARQPAEPAVEPLAGSDGLPVPDGDLSSVLEALSQGDGLVHGCGCGRLHPYAVSAIERDPGKWRRIRAGILTRDKRRCQVPVGGSVCGAHATVAGHKLARVLGGCDHPHNLRAECTVHSAQDGAVQGNALKAIAAAVLRAQRPQAVTDGDFLSPAHELGPAMNVLPAHKSIEGEDEDPLNDLRRGRAVTSDRSAVLAEVDETAAGFLRSPGPDSPVWDDAPWLDWLRDVPDDASWPRLMTLPHPDAVGSYGDEVARLFEMRTGGPLRWWQQLADARALEHDRDGRLVWRKTVESTARQVGKSTNLRERMWWRTEQTSRWGEQLVLHTGKDQGIVQEVMQPAMVHADRLGLAVDWRTSHWQIQRSVNLPPPPRLVCGVCDGSRFAWPLPGTLCAACGGEGLAPEQPARQLRGRWIARTWRAVYGWSPGFGVVDEAWKVPARAVEDGIWPSLVEQVSPQLALVSTAHPEATGLMLGERALAVLQLFRPVDTLLLEWSTPTDLDVWDEAGWRMASPHWTEQRRALIAGALRSAEGKVASGNLDSEDPDPVASFRCQWLNQWPQDVEQSVSMDEVLASEDQWAGLVDPDAAPAAGATLVVAVEDDLGRGAAAAAAALTDDGRVVVGGWRFSTLREAVDWCEDTAATAVDAVMLAGASLVGDRDAPMDPELEGVDLPVEPAGGVEMRDGLPTLRALVRGGRLAHDGGADVSRSVLGARVRTSAAGALLVDPDALLRCVVWVARRAHRDRD